MAGSDGRIGTCALFCEVHVGGCRGTLCGSLSIGPCTWAMHDTGTLPVSRPLWQEPSVAWVEPSATLVACRIVACRLVPWRAVAWRVVARPGVACRRVAWRAVSWRVVSWRAASTRLVAVRFFGLFQFPHRCSLILVFFWRFLSFFLTKLHLFL